MIEENDKKTKEMYKKIKIQEERLQTKKSILSCEECRETFKAKLCLRNHVNTKHPKICYVTFIILNFTKAGYMNFI